MFFFFLNYNARNAQFFTVALHCTVDHFWDSMNFSFQALFEHVDYPLMAFYFYQRFEIFVMFCF